MHLEQELTAKVAFPKDNIVLANITQRKMNRSSTQVYYLRSIAYYDWKRSKDKRLDSGI